MCEHIFVCLAGGNKGSKSRVGFMMKFGGNLKSPIIEPESEKNRGTGGNGEREVEGEKKVGRARDGRWKRKQERGKER